MSEKNTVALNERDSSSLLSSCGVRMVASVLLDKPDRAAFEAASRQLGFPVAMKVLSDDILHKTDVGCVVLNVTDVDGMQAAYDTIMANAAKNAPGARVQGVLAEQMLPKGFEVLLGVSTDPQFGHVIMAGLGGVLVELLHAVSLRVLPITRQDAEDMIDETPLAKACQVPPGGDRGGPDVPVPPGGGAPGDHRGGHQSPDALWRRPSGHRRGRHGGHEKVKRRTCGI